MKTEKFKDGPVTYAQSKAMVTLAEKWLLEYLVEFGPKRPGDMEDDFCGEPGLGEMLRGIQGRWRASPFYPALARLVDKGQVGWARNAEGVVWYAAAPTEASTTP